MITPTCDAIYITGTIRLAVKKIPTNFVACRIIFPPHERYAIPIIFCFPIYTKMAFLNYLIVFIVRLLIPRDVFIIQNPLPVLTPKTAFYFITAFIILEDIFRYPIAVIL